MENRILSPSAQLIRSLGSIVRKALLALLPFALFGIIYSLLGLYPNYLVRPIDTTSIYHLELRWFGIVENGVRMIPSAWFDIHHCVFADVLSAVFYLCWVPVPMLFALWLCFRGQTTWCTRFSWAFLMVNLVGFIIYYIYPASPPWYVLKHGFTPVVDTPGDAAALLRVDAWSGGSFFRDFYSRSSNVFAAIPSLHAAYVLVATIYAAKSRQPLWLKALLGAITLGIWWAAVYTTHHYVIDVILGILTAIVGVALLEWQANGHGRVSRFLKAYARYLK